MKKKDIIFWWVVVIVGLFISYKIVVSCNETGQNLDAIAFILPNTKTPNSMLPQFITTIDEVERLTSLDFLHDLDHNTEAQLEAKKTTMWR